MKIIFFLFTILILFPQCKNKKIELNIPWYVSKKIRADGKVNYNYRDSLKKYTNYQIKTIKNKDNYFSYLSNLTFLADSSKTEKAIEYLDKSYNLNKDEFCIRFINPILDYVKPQEMPDRKYTMPFILDLDLGYFLNKCEECGFIKEKIDKEKIDLRLSYLMLKDQWFRIPNRNRDSLKQELFDIQVREEIDLLYEAKKLDFADYDVREKIFVILLHSTDCEWTNRWLNTYIDEFRNEKWYVKHLYHFLWRSTCVNEEMEKKVKLEIKNSLSP